ncbi:FecR family protein [Marinifilum fragile]|uniref:FecR family protein n=1 Tax=Marinifilum fragile TaxID=570161 RepID=UPI002AAAA726|nr:FecR family protein [Marinifilum fragile]
MKENNQNITPGSEMDFINSLPKIDVTYSKSKEEVWKELSAMTMVQKPKAKVISLSWRKYAAAACILLLIGFAGFTYFYTSSTYCPKGKHMCVTLPDNSKVELNANSSISYKPYMWNFTRKVKFKGEAFFDITKGSKFEIESQYGKTFILGTSFNIYARGNDYKVTCYTGKVKVVSTITSDKILLLPNDHAYLNKNGKLEVFKDEKAKDKVSWRNHFFLFNATPLKDVFKEIELQYDIHIVEKGKFNKPYTGNFGKEMTVDQVLYNVCKSSGLNFVKGPRKNYIITSKSQ